jgi:hypothetical protein
VRRRNNRPVTLITKALLVMNSTCSLVGNRHFFLKFPQFFSDHFVPGGQNDAFDMDFASGVVHRGGARKKGLQDDKKAKKRKANDDSDLSDDDASSDDGSENGDFVSGEKVNSLDVSFVNRHTFCSLPKCSRKLAKRNVFTRRILQKNPEASVRNV